MMPIALLAAEANRFLQIGERAKPGGAASGWNNGLLAAGIALAVGLVLWLAVRWLVLDRRTHSPRRLFEELCAAHGLSYRQRGLLMGLAAHLRLPQPSILFVEPALWDKKELGPSWSKRSPELDAIKERLFSLA